MSGYGWRCLSCGGSQEVPVWRILDVRERPDVIAQLGPGLAFAVCPACGTEAAIEAPMLLIRPGNELPLLLAVSSSELGGQSPPSGQELAAEAQAAIGRVIEGVVGPMIPLPRLLLPLVLTRDVAADAADPDGACQELHDVGTAPAGWYRSFLQVVRDSEPERHANLPLEQLRRASPGDLPDFLRAIQSSAAPLRTPSSVANSAQAGQQRPLSCYRPASGWSRAWLMGVRFAGSLPTISEPWNGSARALTCAWRSCALRPKQTQGRPVSRKRARH
jgi:hypothetical protein